VAAKRRLFAHPSRHQHGGGFNPQPLVPMRDLSQVPRSGPSKRAAAPPAGGSRGQIIEDAARRHHIDPGVLWGIYGAESSFGKASNWFGLVAVPRTGSFAGDADASAATLSRLLKANHGSYEQALRHYSGNSYGLAHVKALAKQSGHAVGSAAADGNVASSDSGSGNSSGGGLLGGLDAIGHFFALLTDASTWARIGKILIGGLLLIFAVYEFAKASGAPVPNPAKIAKPPQHERPRPRTAQR
jgi:hypothetical protein